MLEPSQDRSHRRPSLNGCWGASRAVGEAKRQSFAEPLLRFYFDGKSTFRCSDLDEGIQNAPSECKLPHQSAQGVAVECAFSFCVRGQFNGARLGNGQFIKVEESQG